MSYPFSETLLNAEKTTLRQALFSLKRMFQVRAHKYFYANLSTHKSEHGILHEGTRRLP